jgi:uncharacterized protein (TIGR04141 family)
MTDAAETNALTIYLARSGFSEHELVDSSSSIDEFRIDIDDRTQARLFVRSPVPKTPTWPGFFKGYVDTSVFGKNRSTGGVLPVNRESGKFALTFGDGRFLLNRDCFEDSFGLKVTINCIDENTVRSIDQHSLDQLFPHTREQASRDATPLEFGLSPHRVS